MGIKGLLPFLKKSCQQTSLSEFKNQTVAVDTSCWLHKGAFACADRLAIQEDTDVYVKYVLKQVALLISFKVHVILVFDGSSLPAKQKTNKLRNEKRKAMKAKGKQLLAEGRRTEAYDCFKQSTQISFEMVSEVIKACQRFNEVDCIVAPYEADAQLAYLINNNVAQLVLTEDSDLVLFGCSKIMFKLDGNGRGYLYERSKLHLSLLANNCGNMAANKDANNTEYANYANEDDVDFVKFRRACILSGCDYFEGLDGVGLMKAMKFFNKTTRNDLRKVMPLIGLYLSMSVAKIDSIFIDKFIMAEATFLYQPIFDVLSSRKRQYLTKPENLAECKVILACYNIDLQMDDKTCFNFAIGNIHPNTKFTYNDVKYNKPSRKCIWKLDKSLTNEENLNMDVKCNSKTKMSAFADQISSTVAKKHSLQHPKSRSSEKCKPHHSDQLDILFEYQQKNAPEEDQVEPNTFVKTSSKYFSDEIDEDDPNGNSDSDQNGMVYNEEKSPVVKKENNDRRSQRSLFDSLNESPELKRHKSLQQAKPIFNNDPRSVLGKFRATEHKFYSNSLTYRKSDSPDDSTSPIVDSGYLGSEDGSLKLDSNSPGLNPFKLEKITVVSAENKLDESEITVVNLDSDQEDKKVPEISTRVVDVMLSKKLNRGAKNKLPKKQITIRESLAFARCK